MRLLFRLQANLLTCSGVHGQYGSQNGRRQAAKQVLGNIVSSLTTHASALRKCTNQFASSEKNDAEGGKQHEATHMSAGSRHR